MDSVHYHNDYHACDIAQHVSFVLFQQGAANTYNFSGLESIALVVAAFCHDVGHDGFNNKFHVTTKSDRFSEYGSDSLQEKLHVAKTLQTLEQFDFISKHFSLQDVAYFKSMITKCILSTDMALAADLKLKFAMHCQTNPDHSKSSIEDKQTLSNVILHACDISTSLREFDMSTQWADSLFKEYFAQGDIEKQRGLEISFLCDRATTNIAVGQPGFIQHMVLPVFQQLSTVCPAITDVQIKNGEDNI